MSIVAVGVFAFFGNASAAGAIAIAQDQTTAITRAAIGAYASRKDFSGLTTASALSEGWLTVPDTTNAWGGATVIAGGAEGSLTIEQNGVPAGACAGFVRSEVRGFDAIDVNGVRVANRGTSDEGALVSQCEAPASSIVFNLHP